MRRARAWLSRVVEPGTRRLLALRGRRRPGRGGAAAAFAGGRRSGSGRWRARGPGRTRASPTSRRAERCGARLVIPEDDEWPALPLHALTVAVADEPDDHRTSRTGRIAPVPPVALWVRGPGPAGRAGRPLGGDRRVPGVDGVRRARRRPSSGTSWGSAAGRSSPAGRSASTPPPTAGRWPPRRRRWRCWPAAWTGPIRRRTARCSPGSPRPDCWSASGRPARAPLRHRFLVRNRLIAALTRGTVVVEAAARSGAQATARRARKLGREVMVVPGPVTSAMSVGCHELLREREEGATLVTTAAQVIETVGSIGVDLADPAERPADAAGRAVRPGRRGCWTPARCAAG